MSLSAHFDCVKNLITSPMSQCHITFNICNVLLTKYLLNRGFPPVLLTALYFTMLTVCLLFIERQGILEPNWKLYEQNEVLLTVSAILCVNEVIYNISFCENSTITFLATSDMILLVYTTFSDLFGGSVCRYSKFGIIRKLLPLKMMVVGTVIVASSDILYTSAVYVILYVGSTLVYDKTMAFNNPNQDNRKQLTVLYQIAPVTALMAVTAAYFTNPSFTVDKLNFSSFDWLMVFLSSIAFSCNKVSWELLNVNLTEFSSNVISQFDVLIVSFLSFLIMEEDVLIVQYLGLILSVAGRMTFIYLKLDASFKSKLWCANEGFLRYYYRDYDKKPKSKRLFSSISLPKEKNIFKKSNEKMNRKSDVNQDTVLK